MTLLRPAGSFRSVMRTLTHDGRHQFLTLNAHERKFMLNCITWQKLFYQKNIIFYQTAGSNDQPKSGSLKRQALNVVVESSSLPCDNDAITTDMTSTA